MLGPSECWLSVFEEFDDKLMYRFREFTVADWRNEISH